CTAHEFSQQRGLTSDRVDHVYASLVGCEIDRHRTAREDRCAFAPVVPGETGTRTYPSGRRDRDEHAPTLLAENRDAVPGAPEQALHVDRIHTVELLFGHVQDRLVAMRRTGVVDHDVELAVSVERGLDQSAPVCILRDIRLHELGLTTGAADLSCDPLAAVDVDIVDDDPRTFLCETLGDTFTEPRATAGNDRDFVFQSHLPPPRAPPRFKKMGSRSGSPD